MSRRPKLPALAVEKNVSVVTVPPPGVIDGVVSKDEQPAHGAGAPVTGGPCPSATGTGRWR